jgi:hypothetical protein
VATNRAIIHRLQMEIELYESAAKYLKAKNPTGPFPALKDLKAEKERLTKKRSAQYV